MRAIICTSILTFLFAFSATAQKSPFFSVGPKLGTHHTNFLSKDHSFDKEGILGYQAGAFIRVGISKLYLQPEAYYNFKSTSLIVEENGSGGATDFSGHIKFHNIDVPLLIGSKIIDAKVFNFRVFAGPMVSFLLKNEDTIKNYNPDNYDYNNKIWGGQAGIGIDIGNITLDFRYQSKLTRISNLVPGPEGAIHLSAGIKLF